MIARISGKIKEKTENSLIIENNGVSYEVLIAPIIMQQLKDKARPDEKIELITYHYVCSDPSKSIPILIGFLNSVEKDFFEQFITVAGIGPRAALKALNQPISSIAKAIDEADMKFLQSLPGIGQQKAKLIIAKLQGKVGKYALIQDKQVYIKKERASAELEEEALGVLLQLQYKKQEALAMIKQAMEKRPHLQTIQELLNEVYRQRKVS